MVTLTLFPGDYSYLYTKGTLLGHSLWIHDIARGESQPCQSIQLDMQDQTEVTTITLSPDGLYAALGWMNGQIQVYDSRSLSRGPLHTFSHGPSIAADSGYGIVKMQWVSRHPGGMDLISGGADGKLTQSKFCKILINPHSRLYPPVGYQQSR